METLYDRCSKIIDLSNQWIDRCIKENKEDKWIKDNFPSMFIHLCVGNKSCSIKELFSDIKKIINNQNIIYEIKNKKVSIILFSSLSTLESIRQKSEFLNKIFSKLLNTDKKTKKVIILKDLLYKTDVLNTNCKFKRKIIIEKRKFVIKTIIKQLYQKR